MNLDWTILHWIQDTLVCPALDFLMPKITLLGNGDAVWLLAAAALLITKKYRRYGVLLLVALALGVLTGNLTLKPLIARPRPCWVDESVRLLIPNPTDYSFPSGHTLSSVIGATVLTKANAKFGLAAIPLAALIAFSRLYLYVHYPTDILGAAVLGVAIGLLVCAAGGWVITALTEKAAFRTDVEEVIMLEQLISATAWPMTPATARNRSGTLGARQYCSCFCAALRSASISRSSTLQTERSTCSLQARPITR